MSQEQVVQAVEWQEQTAVVKVAGDIDLSRTQAFQHELSTVLDKQPKRIVVDLSGVEYMDSSGVASLVKLLSRSRTNGIALVLTGMTERVRSVFEITRLDSVFDIRRSTEDALS